MGRARQINLDRVVAVKMLLPGLSSPEYLRRFRTEASTAAGLQHPHIVAIHEVGAWQGRQYLVTDYVEGRSLAEVISGFRFQISDFRRIAQWLKAIAEAVHYAHEHGILHRDLKPSNVLIDEQGQPRVTDFGLAKRFDERSQLTLSGQVLGSPSYLPPEQAEAKRGKVSRRSDVYSLGATLYHAMTGRPPFQGETPTEVLQQVLNREPVEPRRLNPAIPRDLETICLKCLEKEPARRYPSARLVAEELDRFLENKPVQARAIGPVGKAWRWCQRKPVVAGLTVGLILAVILGIAGVLRQSYQANAQRRRAENLLARSEQERYAANIALVQSLIEQTQFGLARELLADELHTRYRGWEWGWLLGRCHLDLMTLPHPMRTTCAFSPDGATLATRGNDSEIRLWNLETGEVEQVLHGTAEIRWPSFSPDGKRLVALIERQPAMVWDVASGSILFRLTNSSPVYVARFSPDGTLIATGDSDGRVRLSDAGTGRFLGRSKPYDSSQIRLAFSPEGSTIAYGGGGWGMYSALEETSVRLWDLITDEVNILGEQGANVIELAFSPDGKLLASAGFYGPKLWDLEQGRERNGLRLPEGLLRAFAVALSPDGRQLALGGLLNVSSWAQVFDLASGMPIRSLDGHSFIVASIGFSRDGSRIATAALDGTRLATGGGDHTACVLTAFPNRFEDYPGGTELTLADRVEAYKRRHWRERLEQSGVRRPPITTRINVLCFMGMVNLPLAATERPTPLAGLPTRSGLAGPDQVDLSSVYNAEFGETWQPATHLAHVDLALPTIPSGLIEIDGVRFEARGIVQLRRAAPNWSWGWFAYPEAVTIEVGQAFSRLHVLHATAWVADPGTTIGAYRLYYASGESHTFPIECGRDLGDWIATRESDPATASPAETATMWATTDPGDERRRIRLFHRSYDNPRPDQEVRRIEFLSTMTIAGPFLVGMTLE